MTIYEDVNQKLGQHDNIRTWLEDHDIIVRRQKLNTGDYILSPAISIDTKKGLQEVYSDLVGDHDRFRNELIRAKEDGIRLIILIEDEEIHNIEEAKAWQNPRVAEYNRKYGLIKRAHDAGRMLDRKIPKPPVSSERLVGMMDACSIKYGVEWEFCHPDETGAVIIKLLTETR